MFVVAVIAGGSQKVQSRRKKPEDRIQGYFIFLTTAAAETTVEGDEILVLGTLVMHENGVLVVHVKGKNPRGGGPLCCWCCCWSGRDLCLKSTTGQLITQGQTRRRKT